MSRPSSVSRKEGGGGRGGGGGGRGKRREGPFESANVVLCSRQEEEWP